MTLSKDNQQNETRHKKLVSNH